MKRIKYEFFKTTKLKIKAIKFGRKNQISRYIFFEEELLVMFLTRLHKIVQKLKTICIN